MNYTDGLITKSIGGLYFVETPLGVLECKARGIFRKMNISPCAGDRVRVEEISGLTGVIAEIYERKNSIVRPPLANLDRLVFVVSTCEPYPNYALLDKFIAVAEFKDIISMIAVTKSDLLINDEIKDIYKDSGAEVFEISYDEPETVKSLSERLAGGISAFTGNTGVGKSTLLNFIDGRFAVETGEVSKKLGRGRHTTRSVELYKLKSGGYIADTPGFSTFDIKKYGTINKEQLEACFREFESCLGKCRFQGCSHTKEQECAVREAVDGGEIPRRRYNSYVEMYDEVKELREWESNKKRSKL
ncbi:MAG: ribosome small subunit-dependent GTPase A [Oscillospiraceae bacterium]|nr:ribosome small subunit-dependent GTPase A [Oscillospiraceae bacterium]